MIYVLDFLFVLSLFAGIITFGANLIYLKDCTYDPAMEGREGVYLKRMTIALAYVAVWFLIFTFV